MKRLLAILILGLALPSVTSAHEIKSGNFVIVHPMVAEAEKDQAFAKGSVSIRNMGKTPDQLLTISAEFAEKVTIDAPVPVAIPADGETVSVPLAFEHIKRKLSEDEAYAGELVFEKAGPIEVDLMVHSHPH